METIIINNSNVWVYLGLTLVILFILFKFKFKFDPVNILTSLINLTHKVNLTLLFFTFMFMFIFSLVDFTNNNIIDFFKLNVKGLLYYSFFSYFVFYGLNFIFTMKDFFRDNDLFAWAFFKNLMEGKK